MNKYIIVASVLLLAGCSDKPKLTDDVDKLAKLSPAGQVTALMQDVVGLFGIAAIIYALNGGSLVNIVTKSKKPDSE